MGADMMIAACRFPTWVGGEPVEPEDWVRLVDSRVRNIRWSKRGEPRFLRGMIQDLDDEFYLDSEEGDEDTGPLTRRETDKLRQLTTQAVLELGKHRREIASLKLGANYWLLTGGPSWGDAPTDAYDWLCVLDISGVFDYPFPR